MFKIVNDTTKTAVITKDSKVVFSRVKQWTGSEEEAIEASSWCEIADLETEYSGDGFTIFVEE